ncbi:glycosyltransferase [bacterium]|nr:glycosyltransferase [bacterium]
MKISIVIPVYNVKKYVERCLKSLINGIDKRNFVEVIIVDDGSIDGSEVVVDEYQNYSNFAIFHKKNGGLSDARNYGLSKANGEYVIFIDSDDEVDSKLFGDLLDKILKSNSDVLLWDAKIINEESNIINAKDNEYYTHRGLVNMKVYDGISAISHQLNNHFDFVTTVWLGAYKKNFLIDNQLYFEKGLLHEDELWTTKTLLLSQTVEYYNVPIYLYRQRSNSIMNSQVKNFERNLKDIIYIYSNLFVYIDWKNLDLVFSKKLKGNLSRRYLHSLSKFDAYKYKKQLKKIKKVELLKNSYRLIDKIRCCLFVLSPFLYCKMK